VKLQAAATDPVSVGLEEPVHIVAVNGESALVPERPARRLSTSGEEQSPSGHAKPPADKMSRSAQTDHLSMTRSNHRRKPSAGRGGT
jgi:hypothetical protein